MEILAYFPKNVIFLTESHKCFLIFLSIYMVFYFWENWVLYNTYSLLEKPPPLPLKCQSWAQGFSHRSSIEINWICMAKSMQFFWKYCCPLYMKYNYMFTSTISREIFGQNSKIRFNLCMEMNNFWFFYKLRVPV